MRKQKLWIAAGCITLGFGIVGLFLPVAPTTPFVLLAAFCFARGSQKALDWLENNKVFGQILKDYRAGLGVPLSTKIISISIMWTGMLISISIVQKQWLTVLLICCGIGVTIHLCYLKTRKLHHPIEAKELSPLKKTEAEPHKNKFLTKWNNLLKRPPRAVRWAHRLRRSQLGSE